MRRPSAILWFERLWLGSTLAWLTGAGLSMGVRRRMIAARPELAGYEWLVPAGFALVLAISLLLWWFAAHRPRPAARIGVVVVAALSAATLVMSLGVMGAHALSGVANLLQLLSSGLCLAAAATLFGTGARAWFGEPSSVEAEA